MKNYTIHPDTQNKKVTKKMKIQINPIHGERERERFNLKYNTFPLCNGSLNITVTSYTGSQSGKAKQDKIDLWLKIKTQIRIFLTPASAEKLHQTFRYPESKITKKKRKKTHLNSIHGERERERERERDEKLTAGEVVFKRDVLFGASLSGLG